MQVARQFAFVGLSLLWSMPALAIGINDYLAARNDRFASGYSGGPLVANTDPSFIGLGYDWSGVGWLQTDGNLSNALLTPRQVLIANHNSPGVSGTLQFASASGQVTSVTVQTQPGTHSTSSTYAPDMATAEFSSLIPQNAGIAITPILFQGYNPSTYANYDLLIYGGAAQIGWNQIASVATGSSYNWGPPFTPDSAYYMAFNFNYTTPDGAQTQGGDSGSPAYIVTGSPGVMYLTGAAYLISTAGTASSGADTFLPMSLPTLDGYTSPSGYLPSVVTPTTARWTGASSNTWGTSGNWTLTSSAAVFNDVLSGGTVMTCASVLFDGLASPQHSITLSGTQGVTSLSFNLTPTPSGGFTFSGSSLTLGEAGLTNNDIHAQTFNNAIILRTSQQWSVGAGGINISASGSLNLGTGQLLYLNGSGNSDFEGAISGGSSGIAKDGSGTLVLGNANNSFSGQIFVHNGTLQFASIQNVGGGNSALGAPTSGSLGTIYLAGALNYIGGGSSSNRVIDVADGPGAVASTTGIINANGAGALTLTGDVLCENNNNSAPYTGTSTLVLQGSGSGLESGIISSNGGNVMSLVKAGGGSWNLSGANSYNGTTTVNSGLLTVSGGGSVGQSTAMTVGGGTLQLDDSALSNNFSSNRLGRQPIALNGGVLNVNLGSTSGGTETFGAVTAALGENTLALSAGPAGSGLVSGGLLSRTAGATLNLTGSLTSAANGMQFSGMPSGSNFIGAGVFVNGADYAVYDAGGYARAMVVGNNAWDYALNSVTAARHVLLTSPATSQPSVSLLTLSLSGASSGFTLAGGATLTLTNGGILKTGGGTVTIGGGTGISTAGEYVLRANAASDQLTLATPLIGGAGLTKSGLGTLLLNAAGDSYSGPTTIDAGTLRTGVAGAIPSASALVITSAASLDLDGQSQTVAGITLDDGSIQNSGAAAALTVGGNTAGVTYAGVGGGSSISGGSLDLASGGAGGSHTFAIARGQGAADLNVQANVADGSTPGQSLVKAGNGILQLSGNDSFTGGSQVQAGALVLGSNNAIPTASSLTLSAGTLNLGGFANSTGTLTMQSGLITGNGSFAATSFNLHGGTLSASLVGGGLLSMTGSGAATITSSNSYSGGTRLSGGTLAVSADYNLGSTAGALTLDGGTLQVLGMAFSSTTRPVTLTASGGAITVADPNNTLTLATQNLGGSGPFTKAGQGNLQLGGSIGSTAITVEDGILRLSGASPQLSGNPSLSLWNVADFSIVGHSETVSSITMSGGTINTGTGSLNLNGPLTYNRSIWPATIQGSLVLEPAGGAISVTQGSSTDLTISANISGDPASGLVKTGNGALMLLGSNTYSGGTTIDGGGLQVGNGGASGSLGSGPIFIHSSTGLGFDLANTLTVDNAITGGGGVSLYGSGTIVFTGTNASYSGGTAINAGDLQIGSGGTAGQIGSGPVNISKNAFLSFDLAGVYTVPAAISGSGALTQLGPGTVVLSTSDGYLGQTLISGGALQANSGVGLPSTSNLFLNDGVLQSNGSSTFTRSIGPLGTQVQWSSLGGGFSANGGTATVNLGNGITLTWGGSTLDVRGTLMFGSASANNETNFENPVNLNSSSSGNGTVVSRTVQVTAGTGGDFALMSGALSNSFGTATLVKTGNGLLLLSGPNTYNGGTQIDAGNLVFSSTGAIPSTSGSGQITINSSGALNVAGAYTTVTGWLGSKQINPNSTGALAISGSSNETINMGAYANLALGAVAPGATYSGALTPAGSGYRLGGGGGTLHVTSNLSGPNSLVVDSTGPGIVVLSGTNTYTGATSVISGTLEAAGRSALPSGGGLVIGADAMQILDAELPALSFGAGESLDSLSPAAGGIGGNDLASLSDPTANSPAVLPATSQPAVSGVPEPGTLFLLLAVVVGGLLWRALRRRPESENR